MPGGSAHRAGYVLSALGCFGRGQGWGEHPPLAPGLVEVRNPAENEHRFRRKADSVPDLSGQGSG